jgi:hypothetical protein
MWVGFDVGFAVGFVVGGFRRGSSFSGAVFPTFRVIKSLMG